ncbi:hypothetical protein [Gordonia polyisoprenivorans]|uniref:hypothetical protein n=1 Tax=Gordonia polyisoprenivorans TaxID=84595 RepID=UPI001AD753F8|nr:hypothetical protein [Gordonia polyisoprenivorans]QTI71281.1 hypothetical protein J6U32_12610 [Gordonia polyisoprenivorans]
MRTVRIPTALAGQDIVLQLPADTAGSALRVSMMGQTQIIEVTRYQAGAPTRFEFTATLPFGTRWHRLGSADMALETLTGQRVALLTNTFGYTGTGDSAGFTLTNSGTTLIGTFTRPGTALPTIGDILAPAKHSACCGSGNSGGPTVDDHTLKTKTTDAAIAQCRIIPLGLSPSEIQSLKEQMWSGDDGMVKQNQLGASTDQIASQGCTRVLPTLREIMIRNFSKRFSDTKTDCEEGEIGPRCEGVVAVCTPQGNDSGEYRAEVLQYIVGANANIPAGGYLTRIGNPRVGTGEARARAAERAAHPDLYPNASIEAGHVPDLTWAGATQYPFMPMHKSVNAAIGNQATKYPVGYRARLFVKGVWVGSNCMPAGN